VSGIDLGDLLTKSAPTPYEQASMSAAAPGVTVFLTALFSHAHTSSNLRRDFLRMLSLLLRHITPRDNGLDRSRRFPHTTPRTAGNTQATPSGAWRRGRISTNAHLSVHQRPQWIPSQRPHLRLSCPTSCVRRGFSGGVQRISPDDEFLDEGVHGVPVKRSTQPGTPCRSVIQFDSAHPQAVDVGLCGCASEVDRDRGASTTTSATPGGSSSPRFRGR
jgi:hypothetical protein